MKNYRFKFAYGRILPHGFRHLVNDAGKKNYIYSHFFSLVLIGCCIFAVISTANANESTTGVSVSTVKTPAVTIERLDLDQCLETALKNHRLRKISKAALNIAEAQYKQALSAYWPQLSFTSTATRMQNAPLFVFPSQPLTNTLGGSSATPFAEAIASAQLAKQGITPTTAPGGQAGYNAALQATTAQVMQGLSSATTSEQRVKIMDRDNISSTLEMIYPIYTGGRRSAASDQAKAGIQVAKESARQTDLQIVNDVKKYYYGAIVAKKLLSMGQDTLEKFQVTLELTENLYKNGAGKVKKTDYLRAQVMAHSIRGIVEELKANEKLARSALGNAIGMDWHVEVEPTSAEIPVESYGEDFNAFVADAHQWNPLLMQVQLGIGASEAKVKEAKSGHLPIMVAFGQLNRIDNSYDAGMVSDENKKNWVIGLRLELPIFKGFRTVNEVREAAARAEKMRQESLLLRTGLALQVKDALIQVGRSLAQVKATRDALDSATENQSLNTRAYRDELVETKDVIEAQMIEFIVHGQYLRSLFDHVRSRNELEFIVGKGATESHDKI